MASTAGGIVEVKLGGEDVGFRDVNSLKTQNLGGKEAVILNSRKNLIIRAGADEKHQVIGNRQVTVEKDEVHEVNGNRKDRVQEDEEHRVNGNRKGWVNKDDDHVVEEGSHSLVILTGNQEVAVSKGSQSIIVHKDCQVTVREGHYKIDVEKSNLKIKVAQWYELLATDIAIKATNSLVLQCGNAIIKIDGQSGVIEIKGTQVRINC